MTWDPYGMPNAPGEPRDHRQHRRIPSQEPVRMRTVAAILGVMALLALLFTVAAHAQDQTPQAEPGTNEERASDAIPTEPEIQPAETEQSPRPLDGQIVEQPAGTSLASGLIGRPIMTVEGEEMGRISDLLISEDESVVGVIVGIGGFLGFGEKAIAVELARLNLGIGPKDDEQLMLNYTRAELEQAPEFVSLSEQRQREQAEQARLEQEQASAAGKEQPAEDPKEMTQ